MSRFRRGVVLATTAAAVLALPATAVAQFTAAPATGSLGVASGSLAAPGSVGLSKRCAVFGLFGASLTVTWTATTSTRATGYSVTAIPSDGSGSITTTVSGAGTTQVTLGVTPGAIYTATVAASTGSWTSPAATGGPIKVSCGLLG